VLIAVASAAAFGGLDRSLADLFFDDVSSRFPLRSHLGLELIGHHLGKSAVVIVWVGLFAVAVAAHWLETLRPWRALLWATVAAMATGPAIVVALKSTTGFACPWDLRRYGGFAAEATSWFVAPVNAGHCFPAGHSAGGFSLFAFVFAARAIDRPTLAGIAFWVALTVGTAFSAVRIAQGAHFLSHTLWAAAIDWLAAGVVFLVLHRFLPAHRDHSP
jgi:membrane-associated PAP2 superfamily phosphatase